MSEDHPLKFEEYLNSYGSLTYRNKGISMMPLIKEGRDLFTVVPKGPGRCRKYDVILYKNKADQYVLHRIVKVRKNDYVILGDNTYSKEYRTDDDILGIMTSFVRNGKTHSVDEAGYKVYSVVRTASYPIRKLWIMAKHIISKILRALHLR